MGVLTPSGHRCREKDEQCKAGGPEEKLDHDLG